MQKLIRYLKYIFSLLKINFGTLLVFELLYKFTRAAIFSPLLYGLIKVAMKLKGLSYLSDETIGTFLSSPVSWVILALWVFLLAYLTLFDICCILVCIHASYREQRIPLLTLIRKGFFISLRVFIQKSPLLVVYLLVIIPYTYTVVIAGYTSDFSIPTFIMEYIWSKPLLATAYVVSWFYIGLQFFRWSYSLPYFCLEKCDFKQARRNSISLMQGHYWKDLIILTAWCAAIIGAYKGVILAGAYLITGVNNLMSGSVLFSSLTVSGFSVLLDVTGAFFYCFSLPLVFLCISLMYYYYKAESGEAIAPPFDDLDTAYRLVETKWMQKVHAYRKRLIAIVVIVVIAINFIYNIADKKGWIDMGVGHNVEVTAHRGYSMQYPENTIPAFKGAIAAGADWVELDVQETKDGTVIVMHDANLKRTTGVKKYIWQVTYPEIKNLDNGSWFNKKYSEVRIPTLEQVILATKGKIKLNIEIKDNGHVGGIDQKVADLIEQYKLQDSCVVSCLKYSHLEAMKSIDKNIQTAYMASLSYGDFSVLKDADCYSVESSMITDSFVKAAHSSGKEVFAWTVDSEESMGKMLNMDVDDIITNEPVEAERLIYEKEHSTFLEVYFNKLFQLS